MQNIREWREGSITKATVVYEIPIDYSYGSDLHPIRNQLLWQTTKKRSILINHAWKTNKPSFLWSILAEDFQWKVCTAVSNIAIWHQNQKKSENETRLSWTKATFQTMTHYNHHTTFPVVHSVWICPKMVWFQNVLS